MKGLVYPPLLSLIKINTKKKITSVSQATKFNHHKTDILWFSSQLSHSNLAIFCGCCLTLSLNKTFLKRIWQKKLIIFITSFITKCDLNKKRTEKKLKKRNRHSGVPVGKEKIILKFYVHQRQSALNIIYSHYENANIIKIYICISYIGNRLFHI